jgi:hypothetical protein
VARHSPRLRVATLETRARNDAELERRAERLQAATDLARAQAYLELPLDEKVMARVARLAERKLGAKARTGGVRAEEIPSPSALAAFLDACVRQGVPFKLTAGLHHAVRGLHPLTYHRDSARAMFHGFLNVFVATAVLVAGHDLASATAALEETDGANFRFDGESVAWRERAADWAALARTRELFGSLGSCSFDEPMADLGALDLD